MREHESLLDVVVRAGLLSRCVVRLIAFVGGCQGIVGHFDGDLLVDRAVPILLDGQNERDHRRCLRRIQVPFDHHHERLVVEPTV